MSSSRPPTLYEEMEPESLLIAIEKESLEATKSPGIWLKCDCRQAIYDAGPRLRATSKGTLN